MAGTRIIIEVPDTVSDRDKRVGAIINAGVFANGRIVVEPVSTTGPAPRVRPPVTTEQG